VLAIFSLISVLASEISSRIIHDIKEVSSAGGSEELDAGGGEDSAAEGTARAAPVGFCCVDSLGNCGAFRRGEGIRLLICHTATASLRLACESLLKEDRINAHEKESHQQTRGHRAKQR
jgi:hypothetical protein